MKPLVLEVPVNGSATIVKMTIDTQIEKKHNDTHAGSLGADHAYASMHEEISKVADPVSFSELKDFYKV